MEDLAARGPHFLCGPALRLVITGPDCGFIPLINVPGSIHSWFALLLAWFALFGLRSLISASPLQQFWPQDGQLDGLQIWFGEITVRGVIFHFVASLLGINDLNLIDLPLKLTLSSHRLIILVRR
jgi:hypothetical protein